MFMSYNGSSVKLITKKNTYFFFQCWCWVSTRWRLVITDDGGSKGQLISECLFGVLNFPKNQQKIWQISALETKKWSNQQSKGTLL